MGAGILSLAHKRGAQEGAQECLEGIFTKSLLKFPTVNSLPSHPPSQPGLRFFSSWNLSKELAFQVMAPSSRSLSPGGSTERGEEARQRRISTGQPLSLWGQPGFS